MIIICLIVVWNMVYGIICGLIRCFTYGRCKQLETCLIGFDCCQYEDTQTNVNATNSSKQDSGQV